MAPFRLKKVGTWGLKCLNCGRSFFQTANTAFRRLLLYSLCTGVWPIFSQIAPNVSMASTKVEWLIANTAQSTELNIQTESTCDVRACSRPPCYQLWLSVAPAFCTRTVQSWSNSLRRKGCSSCHTADEAVRGAFPEREDVSRWRFMVELIGITLAGKTRSVRLRNAERHVPTR